MSRAMEEMRNDTAFKTIVADLVKIMESFHVSVHEALKVLDIPESEHDRYIVAIRRTQQPDIQA